MALPGRDFEAGRKPIDSPHPRSGKEKRRERSTPSRKRRCPAALRLVSAGRYKWPRPPPCSCCWFCLPVWESREATGVTAPRARTVIRAGSPGSGTLVIEVDDPGGAGDRRAATAMSVTIRGAGIEELTPSPRRVHRSLPSRMARFRSSAESCMSCVDAQTAGRGQRMGIGN